MPSPSDPEGSNDYELLPHAEQRQPFMGQEHLSKSEGRQGDALAKYIALCSIAVLTINTWSTVLGSDRTALGWFAFHPTLQTLALTLFTYGILTLQPTSKPKTKASGLFRHQAAVLFVGFPVILLGTFAVVYNKWIQKKPHMTTWHGTFGYFCVMWIMIQIGLGGGSVWFGGVAFGGGLKAKAIWKYHRLSGYLLFSTLMLTVHLGGGWSNWGTKYMIPGVRIVTYVLAPVLILFSVFARLRRSKMKIF